MREMALGRDIFREEQNAAGLFVEPMDDERAMIDLSAEDFDGAGFFGAAGDHRQAGGFVDGDEVGVFEDDWELD